MPKNKNPKSKKTQAALDAKTAHQVVNLVYGDSKKSFQKFWVKFRTTPFGESFLNLHFIARSKQWIVQPNKESNAARHKRDALVGFYNLILFFFYAYICGVFGFGWMIYIPLITNLSLVVGLYAKSISRRVKA